MKITKAECLEFLGESGELTTRMQKVAHLYRIVKWFNGEWPSAVSALKNGIRNALLRGDKTYSIDGFTRREFGRMVWAKNEIKRRENLRKAQEEKWARQMQYGKHFQCRCVMRPLMSKSQVQGKLISEKMKGHIDPSLHDALFSGVDSNANRFTEAFNNLKAEQEEKKMRDSNAELKEWIPEVGEDFEYQIENWAVFKCIGHHNGGLIGINDTNHTFYCDRLSLVRPIKTERQKALEFYLSQVSIGVAPGIYIANEKYYGFAIESLIDSGYLNTKTPPIAR